MLITRRKERIYHEPKMAVFDVGTTLIDESRAFDHRIREAIAGTDITFEQFNEKRKCFAMQNLRGDLEAIDYFGLTRTPWHKEDEYLHGKGYKLGLIANQSLGTEERLRNWGLLKLLLLRSCASQSLTELFS